MEKDVIYIDVEDDITAIISKISASKNSVVALVPPKRIGVLQSAVNLRLIARAAKQADKKLVLVTTNSALSGLAAAASVPVSKNLQSKPEIADAESPEEVVSDDDDVIDGSELAVGEFAKNTPEEKKADERDAAVSAIGTATAFNDAAPAKKAGKKASKASKVPNFDKFRKKLIFIIIGVVLLIAFLIWAIFFAPHATIVIKAKTSDASVNQSVSLSTEAKTSMDDNAIQAVSEEKKDDKSVSFEATGKKDVSKKASGTVEFSTSDARTAIGGVTIPAGTELESSSGLTFVTDKSVTLNSSNFEGASTGITAAEKGDKYNGASGSVKGAPSRVSANITDATSGGLTKKLTVVSAGDVQAAKEKLADDDKASIKKDLASKFDDSSVVLDDSFATSYSDVDVSPGIGEEVDGDAKVSSSVTYTLYAVKKSEISSFLDVYDKEKLENESQQRVYKNGSDKASFQEVSKAKNGATATLVATAKIGPKIEDNDVKKDAAGKRLGDVQQQLESVRGIQDVDIKFFPFWVNTVPDDAKKVSINLTSNEPHETISRS